MSARKAKTVAEGWVPLRHGIPSSYNRGCRCEDCRRCNTERQLRTGCARANQAARFSERELVGDRLVHPNPYGGHGSPSAYSSCGCRCDPCRAAWSRYQAQRRAS